jgi:hypothetical protein
MLASLYAVDVPPVPEYCRYVKLESALWYRLPELDCHPVLPSASKARYALAELLDALTV